MVWLDGAIKWINDSILLIDDNVMSYVTMIIRFVLPILAIIIVTRCVKSLFREKSEAEQWGYLSLPNGARIWLSHWENIIGRSKTSDAYMEYPTLSRSHAAIIRDDNGNWRAYDIGSKTGVRVNNKEVTDGDGLPVKTGDSIKLGGVELVFVSIDKASEYEQAERRTRPGRFIKQRTTLLFVTEFQLLLGLQLCISKGDSLTAVVPACFAALIAAMWTSYIVTRMLKRVAFEVETLAFLLSSIGLAVTASSVSGDMPKQIILMIAGVCMFFAVGWFIRDLGRAKKMRLPIAAAGLALLAVNLVLGGSVFGAKNWLVIGGMSFQPSEFVKIAFIFAGTATLDRLFTRRNLIMFIGFAGACVISLALMNDFGTAMVFFVAYLIIAFLRSGDFATILLSVGGAGFAGLLALRFKSHIAGRFASWGKAWEYASSGGYQQTRALAAAASGGLFGVGAGNGWLKRIFAADTDLVFGMVSEELGLIIALIAIATLLILTVFAVRSAASARSSFYVIGACAAASILTFQMVLNVLGSVDILPFTGVTFPFVSKGGSSLIACWGLLAFVKAADTRQNASFIIKTPKRPGDSRNTRVKDFEFPEDWNK